MIVFDLLLLMGLTLRLTRFVTTDDLGKWWLQDHRGQSRYWSGLDCPFCVGFWIGVAALVSLAAVGGPGHAEQWWRYAAGAFTLNYLVGHLSARVD
jgi:hypothetical protein